MSLEQNKAVLNHLVEFINTGNTAIVDEVVAPDFVERVPLPGQQQGREGLKDVIVMIRRAFPDLEWKTEEMVAEGDSVASRFTWHGTHRGEFLGIPPTGKQITVSGMVFDYVVEGKLVESQILMDTLSMLQQLGVVPPPG
ncbi:MAG TPA: ester cyclase [Ktedonobacteraceae bacterium]|nr:ester cyclase [Ktedonobacteraceae bacterium]